MTLPKCPKSCREHIAYLHNQASAIINKAKKEGRDFTADESDRFDEIRNESDSAKEHLVRLEWQEAEQDQLAQPRTPSPHLLSSEHVAMHAPLDNPLLLGHDRDGREILALTNQQKFADLPRDPSRPSAEGCSLGRLIVAKITGDWRRVQLA